METQPAADAIRDQLDRMLNSGAFSNAGRQCRLLRYLVDRTLANEGARLKEYVVATEVFDRPDTYDPRLDSIVRVEARRLRARLEDYYGGPGAADPVIISIPRGSYVPHFCIRKTSPDAAGVAQPVIGTRSRSRSLWLAATAVAAMLSLAALQSEWMRTTAAADTVTVPALAVLPFEPYSSIADHRLLAGRLTDDVTAALASLQTVSVASRASTLHFARDSQHIRELAEALNVQYVVEASAVVQDARLRVVLRLVDVAIDRKVWVRVYEVDSAEAPSLALRIAEETARAAVEHRAHEEIRAARW